jgi:outer membrane PBP1 activator LpoA protein
MKTKKTALIGLAGLSLGLSSWVSAEILVILPQTGSMANAAESIKRGLLQANLQAEKKYKFKFVDSEQQPIKSILQKNVHANTELVIGPLDKKQVQSLIQLKPKVKVLALNQVPGGVQNVYQYALSKEDDAQALSQAMRKQGIQEVIVLREQQTAKQTESFYQAMKSIWGEKLQDKTKLPFFSRKHQAALVLGSGQWVSAQKLPQKNIYTLPYAIEEKHSIPEGMIFCDTPALYVQQWSDVINAYQQQPVSMPYQRLIAFGGDTWQLAHALVQQQKIAFDGRTGRITLHEQLIQRQPQCFEYHQQGIKAL